MAQDRRLTRMIVGGAVACLFVFVSARSLSAAAPNGDVEKVYLDKCSVCHGADGAAKTAKGRKLNVKDVRSPEVQKMSEVQWSDIIIKGKGKDMDGFEKELGKETCQKLAGYMRDLAKK